MRGRGRYRSRPQLNSKAAWHTPSPSPLVRAALRIDSHHLGFVEENIIRSSHSTDRVKSKRMSKKKRDITLPTAVELIKRRVKFAAHKGLLNEIRFDGRTCAIHFPTDELDSRAGAVMRNLLAFEAFSYREKEKPLKCYVDLMDRLIRKAADAELLGNAKIIQSYLGSDEEVANIWNGMGKILEKESNQ